MYKFMKNRLKDRFLGEFYLINCCSLFVFFNFLVVFFFKNNLLN